MVFGEAGVDRTGLDAGVAVDAFLRVDEERRGVVVVGLVGGGVDAVDRTDLDAGVVFGADGRLCDDVLSGPRNSVDDGGRTWRSFGRGHRRFGETGNLCDRATRV